MLPLDNKMEKKRWKSIVLIKFEIIYNSYKNN